MVTEQHYCYAMITLTQYSVYLDSFMCYLITTGFNNLDLLYASLSCNAPHCERWMNDRMQRLHSDAGRLHIERKYLCTGFNIEKRELYGLHTTRRCLTLTCFSNLS